MSSRMSKYYEDVTEKSNNTRFHKNEELYREISKNELDNFEIKSNTTILGENKNEIDVEKIKKILDTKYNEIPKRQSIRIEEEKIEEEQEAEDTKEYDINVILEKAREQKTEKYEEERLKKLRDTQFDILKNLKIDKDEEYDSDEDVKDRNLKKLIDTIALNESNNTSLDILSDLKGSDNTEVLEGLKEEIDKKETEEEQENNTKTETKMVDSFYTSSNAIKEKDFEDIDDFSKSIESNNTFVKVIIAIVVIVFIVGLVLIIKSIYFS